MAGLPRANAFVLGGPINEAWQVRDLGYNITERGDLNAPKNLGEEYRRNLPVYYYAFDQSFLDYYGSNGVWAVDQAFGMLNAVLSTNVSSWSADLSEFPLAARRNNWRAGTVQLYDLKSHVFGMLLEQLGLGDAIRFNFCIHDRNAGADCPIGNSYLVTMRNFGIVPSALDELQYSPYINGVLYTYFIRDYCQNPPPGYGLSEAANMPVNPADTGSYLPVASGSGASLYSGGLEPGAFFNGLTRDDAAGLRYLLRGGNVNWEGMETNMLLFYTNTAPTALQFLVTSNLTDLISASLTNDDAGLLALYPNLAISSSVPYFTNLITSNLIAYYTNYPWNYAGNLSLVTTLQYETNVAVLYRRSFANVTTNYLGFRNGYVFPNNDVFTNAVPTKFGTVLVIETNIGTTSDPYGPVGNYITSTNITSKAMVTNLMSGDYFLIPTNSCGYVLLSNLLSKTMMVTNTIIASNAVTGTVGDPNNQAGSTNFSFYSRTYVTFWTNHAFAYLPVQCVSNVTMLRRGIESIRFVRRDYDSLYGQTWYPITNLYTLTSVTNNTNWVQTYQRVSTAPDFIFRATDMVPGPTGLPDYFIKRRSLTFNTNNSLPGLAGPGTIDTPTFFTFNKSGPVYYNESTNQSWFLSENLFYVRSFQLPTWGSFDDSTNTPVVYPTGTSIENLENMMLMQVTTPVMPDGALGVAYSAMFGGYGGTAPYTWSLAPNSPALPPGLMLSTDGSGYLYGTPRARGTYDFMIQMTDATGRFVVWDITVTIN
ncbi:MAG TPA: Ig domain-containing protein, partial [Bacillota bacterium]|nr:Ig domain-containing protein [Bacillota bacterium]